MTAKNLTYKWKKGVAVADVSIPPYSFITLERVDTEAACADVDSSDLVLENDYICYVFDEDGQLISAYDKEADHQLIKSEAPGNVLSVYHDDPVEYDAWDIDLSYENQLVETAKGVSAAKNG